MKIACSNLLLVAMAAGILGLAATPFAASVSQTAGHVRLSGRVIDDKTKQPLPGANIYFPELKRGTVSDRDGKFRLANLPRGEFLLICKFIGYTDLEITIDLSDDIERTFALQPTTLEFSAVTVTAEQDKLTESSQALTVVTPKALEKMRGQTLGETLKEIPGVTTLQTGPAISKPVIRGLHSQRILVLNAGVPQEGQQWGGEHAPEIDPFAPARIEVIKGAAGVQYGAGAIGGVIRVAPRELPNRPGLGGQLTFNGFSNNLQGAGSLLLEGALKRFPQWGWRMQGSLRKAGDAKTPAYRIDNSGFVEGDWSAALGYHTERSGAEVYYSHFGTELGIYRGAHIGNVTDLLRALERGQPATTTDFSYEIQPPKQDISHNLLSLQAHHHVSNVGRFELQYGWQQNHRQEFDAHKPFSSEAPTVPSFDLTLTTYTADLVFQHDPIKNIFGRIGVSGMRQGNVQNGTILLIPNFRAYSGGIFAHETWTKGRLTIEAGGRYDYRSKTAFLLDESVPAVQRHVRENLHEYGNFTGVVGAIYQFASAWSIGTNLGSAWRPPSLNELYSDGVHHGTATFEIGDLNLKSERSLNLDATLRHAGERSRLELSVYNNRMRNFIFLFPDPEPTLTIRGAFPTFRYQQAEAVLRGIEGRFEHQLTNFLLLGATASLVRGQNLASDEPLYLMPADRIKIDADFKLPDFSALRESYLEIIGTFVGHQDRVPSNADYTEPPGGYSLLDLNFGTRWHISAQPVQINLSVRNLFNATYRDYLSRYRYFIDDPGRDLVLRVQIPFGRFEQR